MMLKTYGSVRLLDISADKPDSWTYGDATHVRIQLPAEEDNLREMRSRDFLYGDRTIGVSIGLKNPSIDATCFSRFHLTKTDEYREEIVRIAQESFRGDTRFYFTPDFEQCLANFVIQEWVNEIEEFIVCLHGNTVMGFIGLEKESEKSSFIKLAAVDKRYRLSGAAVALYTKAICLCKEEGLAKLNGRISSKNMPVMNLYASFGARFNAPIDVYLKEVG